MQIPVTVPNRRVGWPRRWPVRAALAVVALTLLLAVAVATQPVWLSPLVSERLTSLSGRSVVLESVWFGIDRELDPVLHVHGVRIANVPWADVDKPFAALGEFTAELTWPTLFAERVIIRRIVLRDGEVDLERLADGLRNWRLSKPEDRGPGRFRVLSLQAERASVRLRHQGIDFVAELSSEPTTDAELPVRIEFAGRWRELPFAGSAATGAVLTFIDTATTFPLRGELHAGGAVLQIDGRAGDVFRDPLLDARVSVAGNDLAPFHAFIGQRYAHVARRAFRVEGQVHAADHGLTITAAKARFGSSDMAGELRVERPGDASRQVVHAALRSDLLDSADLRWLAGSRAASPASAAASPEPRGRLEAARTIDGEATLEVRELRAGEAPWLHSAKLKATLADGRLALRDLDLGVLQGRATGRIDADLRASPPSAEAEVLMSGLRMESLLHDAPEKHRVTGSLRAQGKLRASGDTAQALLASAAGQVHATMTGGTISSLLDAEIGLQGGKIVKSLIAGSEPIPIRCAAMTLDLRNGSGQLRSLVLDTERTRTTGSGRIDLHAQTLDVLLTPESKQGGLFVLDRSIHLHGSLKKPARELVARVGGAVSAANAGVCRA